MVYWSKISKTAGTTTIIAVEMTAGVTVIMKDWLTNRNGQIQPEIWTFRSDKR